MIAAAMLEQPIIDAGNERALFAAQILLDEIAHLLIVGLREHAGVCETRGLSSRSTLYSMMDGGYLTRQS